jgi:thioredoxin reductase
MCYELVIIGAGKSGMKAAITAGRLGLKNVLMVDYEKRIGGFRSILFNRNGFELEKKLIEDCEKLPFEFWYQSTVVGFFTGEDGENHQISVQTPTGLKDIEAKRVILSSGSLDKPREAHQIAGARPAGVITPTLALGLLERGFVPGRQCIVFENGKIAKAVADILEENGSDVERLSGASLKITNIKGNSRISEVGILDMKTGEILNYPCDTLIFSEGSIPCTFFLKGTSVGRDKQHYIIVDEKGKTNIPGVFAYGSCTIRHSDDTYEKTLNEVLAV